MTLTSMRFNDRIDRNSFYVTICYVKRNKFSLIIYIIYGTEVPFRAKALQGLQFLGALRQNLTKRLCLNSVQKIGWTKPDKIEMSVLSRRDKKRALSCGQTPVGASCWRKLKIHFKTRFALAKQGIWKTQLKTESSII